MFEMTVFPQKLISVFPKEWNNPKEQVKIRQNCNSLVNIPLILASKKKSE